MRAHVMSVYLPCGAGSMFLCVCVSVCVSVCVTSAYNLCVPKCSRLCLRADMQFFKEQINEAAPLQRPLPPDGSVEGVRVCDP